MTRREAVDGEPVLRRADARRNIELILDAASVCLGRDPDASVAEIAKEAGLGRVTVYGHFKSRPDIVEAVVTRTLAAANEALEEVDLSGDAASALRRLIDATWEVTMRSGSLVVAAEKALPAAKVRDLHSGGLEERVREFLRAGQQSGAFRGDLPADWLMATFHAVLHAAATEIDAGRLDPGVASDVIASTMLAVLQHKPGADSRR
jgi:TetR/AcrR family transcriptional regulator, mexCD-oprJ operon repressor